MHNLRVYNERRCEFLLIHLYYPLRDRSREHVLQMSIVGVTPEL